VLAWRLAATRNSRVTRAVLDAALRRRRPDAGLIFHSDRGSELQWMPVRMRLAASGVRQSMTRGGAPGENAHMESFFHSLKADVIHGRSFLTVADLRRQLRRYVRHYKFPGFVRQDVADTGHGLPLRALVSGLWPDGLSRAEQVVRIVLRLDLCETPVVPPVS
jgi:transposase InsO family protein